MEIVLSDAFAVCHAAVAWYVKLLVLVLLVDLAVSTVLWSARLRYYACYFCYVATASVVSVAFLPLLIARFRDPHNSRLAIRPARALARTLGIRWEVRGAKQLQDEAAIVTVNHQSIFDLMGVLNVGRGLDKAWGVARKEVFYVWPFGLAMWLAGVVFIDRRRGRDAYAKLRAATDECKRQGTKLVMFPEGTRNRQGETLLPFKRGAFRTAIEAQLPIVPVVLSPYHFIDSEKKTFGRGRIIVSILPAISTEGRTLADLEAVADETRDLMEREFQKLRLETQHDCGVCDKGLCTAD